MVKTFMDVPVTQDHFLVFILDVDIEAACLLRQDPRSMGLYEPAPGLLRQAEDDAEGLPADAFPGSGKKHTGFMVLQEENSPIFPSSCSSPV